MKGKTFLIYDPDSKGFLDRSSSISYRFTYDLSVVRHFSKRDYAFLVLKSVRNERPKCIIIELELEIPESELLKQVLKSHK